MRFRRIGGVLAVGALLIAGCSSESDDASESAEVEGTAAAPESTTTTTTPATTTTESVADRVLDWEPPTDGTLQLPDTAGESGSGVVVATIVGQGLEVRNGEFVNLFDLELPSGEIVECEATEEESDAAVDERSDRGAPLAGAHMEIEQTSSGDWECGNLVD